MTKEIEAFFQNLFSTLVNSNSENPTEMSLKLFLELISEDAALVTVIKQQFTADQIATEELSLQACVALISPLLRPLWLSEQPKISFSHLLNITRPAAMLLCEETNQALFTGENAPFTLEQMLAISWHSYYALNQPAIRVMVTQAKPLITPRQLLAITPGAICALRDEKIRALAMQPEPLFTIEDILNERYDFFRLHAAFEIEVIHRRFLAKAITLTDIFQMSSWALSALSDSESNGYSLRDCLLEDHDLDLVNDIFPMSSFAYRCLIRPEILVLTQKPLRRFSLRELLGVSDLGGIALRNPDIRALIEGPTPQIEPRHLLHIKIGALKVLEDNEARALVVRYFNQAEFFYQPHMIICEALLVKDIRELLMQENPQLTPKHIMEMRGDVLNALKRPENMAKIRSGELSFDQFCEQVIKQVRGARYNYGSDILPNARQDTNIASTHGSNVMNPS